MSARGSTSPGSSEAEKKTRQKKTPQPRNPAAEKNNGTRRRAHKPDQQNEKQRENPSVETEAKTADCFTEEAGKPTAGTVVQIDKARTKSTKKTTMKTKQEDHNSAEGEEKSPEFNKSNRTKTPKEDGEETLKANSMRTEEALIDIKEMSLENSTIKPEETKNGSKVPKTTKAKKSNKEKPDQEKIEDQKKSKKTKAASKEDYILRETLKKLTIKREERSNVAKKINDIKKRLIKHLKEETNVFKKVQEPLNTGSYYEKMKISNPDEFDVMLPLLVERVNIEPFTDDGAFYKVSLNREQNPLKSLWKDGSLPASEILAEFRKEVEKFLEKFEGWEMTPTKPGCPAVTLTTKVGSILVSLDLVLCLQVKSSWPYFTLEGFKIEGWLGAKTKQEHKWKPYYLVPKYEGNGSAEHNGFANKDGWRISFSHIEKEILKNHGSVKTCCEKGGESCCRKACLKLLKHLLHLLKESDSSLEDFSSYHTKTTLLHACCKRNKDEAWKASDLLDCFNKLLEDFEDYLKARKLQNFFVPSQNLFSGISEENLDNLAKKIEEQRRNGFSIFEQGL